MFAWYQTAQVCYAYLADVFSAGDDPRDPRSDFRRSMWFTRGWTLQELLAPSSVEFYDRSWVEIGTKKNMVKTIQEITGITELFNFQKCCIAQKMSWAAKRATTRAEDMAYCLMGLFDVHMPLLYGEGNKAFTRLQLEILSKTDDESIFCWNIGDINIGDQTTWTRNLLAPSPSHFRHCGDLQREDYIHDRTPWATTNKGFRFRMQSQAQYVSARELRVPLNCSRVVHNARDGEVGTRKGLALIVHCGPHGDNVIRTKLEFSDGAYGPLSEIPTTFNFPWHERPSIKQQRNMLWVKVRPCEHPSIEYSVADTLLQASPPQSHPGFELSWDIASGTEARMFRGLSSTMQFAALKFSDRTASALFLVMGIVEDNLWLQCSIEPNIQSLEDVAWVASKKQLALGSNGDSWTKDRFLQRSLDGTRTSVVLKNGVVFGESAYIIVINREANGSWADKMVTREKNLEDSITSK